MLPIWQFSLQFSKLAKFQILTTKFCCPKEFMGLLIRLSRAKSWALAPQEDFNSPLCRNWDSIQKYVLWIGIKLVEFQIDRSKLSSVHLLFHLQRSAFVFIAYYFRECSLHLRLLKFIQSAISRHKDVL